MNSCWIETSCYYSFRIEDVRRGEHECENKRKTLFPISLLSPVFTIRYQLSVNAINKITPVHEKGETIARYESLYSYIFGDDDDARSLCNSR